jgi:hypothetical protein
MRQAAAGFDQNQATLVSISRTMNYIVKLDTSCPFHTLQAQESEEISSPGVSNTSTSEKLRQ